MKKLLVLPNLTQPALGNLQGWGVDNIRRQRVPAVHDSEGKLFLTQAVLRSVFIVACGHICDLLLLFQRLFSKDCC